MPIIKVTNTDIPYDIVINKKLKNLRVSIGINGVKVSMPYSINIPEVEKILLNKSQWLYKHYIRFQHIMLDKAMNEWSPDSGLMFRGKKFEITVDGGDKKGVSVYRFDDSFKIIIDRNIKGTEKNELIKIAFERMYKNIAKDLIEQRVSYYSSIMGLSYNKVTIKDQKTRWGSCSKKGNLNFNYRLIMAPDEVADYVVIHELCHLKHLNHSEKFWNMVRMYMPDYEQSKKWLKDNGANLFAF
ncbi:hypothetical protein OXPF_32920 [Oxobacter pfennigii]|uniref:YgjP-like metallopeptidase domain-containing protein n=1 Tax=Oxobacter pfennigii TaxID=36849 RepID=A0A0P8Y8I9_9CLOT|nr:SprT family zinc-dependent metalloprotease [Oxobacter pfennigii]KPU43042.1 hypothetical protein OXPF_32920 [Oxobacter pfennigii]